MDNLQKMSADEISGKTMIGKNFLGSGEGDAPSRAYHPSIDEINSEVPSGATHYYIRVEEKLFWGKLRWTSEVLFFKEKEQPEA